MPFDGTEERWEPSHDPPQPAWWRRYWFAAFCLAGGAATGYTAIRNPALAAIMASVLGLAIFIRRDTDRLIARIMREAGAQKP